MGIGRIYLDDENDDSMPNLFDEDEDEVNIYVDLNIE